MNWEEEREQRMKKLQKEQQVAVDQACLVLHNVMTKAQRLVLIETKLVVTGLVNGGERRRVTVIETEFGRVTVDCAEP